MTLALEILMAQTRMNAATNAWAERAHREIHAMAVVRHRSMGQLFRYARERLLNPKEKT